MTRTTVVGMNAGKQRRSAGSAGRRPVAAAGAVLALLTAGWTSAQTSAPPASGSSAPPAAAAHGDKKSTARPGTTAVHYRPDRFAGRAGTYYRIVWGVDSLSVKWGESGELIRFSYRVLDADKARVLNDKKVEPSLVDPEAGVKLVVPSMENVGQLRQTAPPEEGKVYWVVFSNKGRLVKRCHHVNVVIGTFHADGLVID